jgi:hypothetical protein
MNVTIRNSCHCRTGNPYFLYYMDVIIQSIFLLEVVNDFPNKLKFHYNKIVKLYLLHRIPVYPNFIYPYLLSSYQFISYITLIIIININFLSIPYFSLHSYPAGRNPPPLPYHPLKPRFQFIFFFSNKFNSENNETPFSQAILLDGFRNKRWNLTGYNVPDNVI